MKPLKMACVAALCFPLTAHAGGISESLLSPADFDGRTFDVSSPGSHPFDGSLSGNCVANAGGGLCGDDNSDDFFVTLSPGFVITSVLVSVFTNDGPFDDGPQARFGLQGTSGVMSGALNAGDDFELGSGADMAGNYFFEMSIDQNQAGPGAYSIFYAVDIRVAAAAVPLPGSAPLLLGGLGLLGWARRRAKAG